MLTIVALSMATASVAAGLIVLAQVRHMRNQIDAIYTAGVSGDGQARSPREFAGSASEGLQPAGEAAEKPPKGSTLTLVERARGDRSFNSEDAIGRWLAECCEYVDGHSELTHALHQSWCEWATRNGQIARSVRSLADALVARDVARWRHPENRRMGFAGVRLRGGTDVLSA